MTVSFQLGMGVPKSDLLTGKNPTKIWMTGGSPMTQEISDWGNKHPANYGSEYLTHSHFFDSFPIERQVTNSFSKGIQSQLWDCTVLICTLVTPVGDKIS